jgi:4-amino-4-deoxy-L-arabinose transferase-like glycosyltransferase
VTKKQIVILVLVALVFRLAYHQLVPFFDGTYNNSSDTGKYILRAFAILEHGEMLLEHNGKMRVDYGRMPLYPHFLAAMFWLTGGENLSFITAVQAVFSSLTVVAVGLIAGAFDRRWIVPAALLASVWPAFIVYTAWVLTDSIFIDLFTWGLCACIWATKRARPLPLLVAGGVAFGIALLTRPVLMFFPYLLVPFLAYLLFAGQGRRWKPALAYALVPAIILLSFLGPRLLATYNEYGTPVVTTQSGGQALELVYPCLRTDADCDRHAVNQRRFEMVAAALQQLSEEERENPLNVDRIHRQVALEQLRDVPPHIFLLAVVDSSARSILQTMFYEVGDQLNQNPRYFSAVEGESFRARLSNFLAEIPGSPFMAIWAIAQSAVLFALPIQIIGLVASLRDPTRRPLMLFLFVTAAYFLAVNLSFGNPKYGIPLNPVQIILLVAGCQVIFDWWRHRLRTT